MRAGRHGRREVILRCGRCGVSFLQRPYLRPADGRPVAPTAAITVPAAISVRPKASVMDAEEVHDGLSDDPLPRKVTTWPAPSAVGPPRPGTGRASPRRLRARTARARPNPRRGAARRQGTAAGQEDPRGRQAQHGRRAGSRRTAAASCPRPAAAHPPRGARRQADGLRGALHPDGPAQPGPRDRDRDQGDAVGLQHRRADCLQHPEQVKDDQVRGQRAAQ